LTKISVYNDEVVPSTENLVSFSGLFFVAFGTLTRKHYGSSLKYEGWKFTSNIIPSFACGALLATTGFLIIA
jgi:hypothetical protein